MTLPIKLKACPRCGGDLFSQGDWWGGYVSCLQCGYAKDVVHDGPRRKSEPIKIAALPKKKRPYRPKATTRQIVIESIRVEAERLQAESAKLGEEVDRLKVQLEAARVREAEVAI